MQRSFLTLFFAIGALAQPNLTEETFLALNDEMKAFLTEKVEFNHSNKQRLHSLVYSIFSEDGLGLKYGNHHTKTPIETYESRNGNCMSFTMMFVAMARQVGLRAQFQEVESYPTWDRRGELVMNNKHMNAIVIIEGRMVEVDFLPFQDKRRHFTRRINDTRALAHYFNNCGAEAFAQGEPDLALAHFNAALETDPEFSRAWSNFGVYWRHQNKLDKAESCYEKAIDLNRFEYTAMSNLVYLYERTGRVAEAQKYARKVQKYRNRNPFYHYDQGLAAHATGQHNQALESYKKALRLRPKESEFYHAVARVYYDMDDAKEVEKNLRLAERYALTPDEKSMYSSKLDYLAKR